MSKILERGLELAFETAGSGPGNVLECGGKRSATPLWICLGKQIHPKRRRRFALPAHSI